ncbi:MAG: ComEC/Rec2 family competence protein, partial [Lachnospiraceae bacterium]
MARGIVLLAILCLLLFRGNLQKQNFEAIKQIPEQTRVTVTGVIYKKEFKKEDYLYYLKDVCIKSDSCVIKTTGVIVRTSEDLCRIGDAIRIRTQMRWLKRGRNSGGFDEQGYYHSLGVCALLYVDESPEVLKQRRRCPVKNGLFLLRQQMRRGYLSFLNEKDAGILSSMVLGDKSLMEDEIRQLYTSAGISHILAVSGLHVSIIGRNLFLFLRKRRQKYGVCCLVSGLILMLFCVMSGLSVSALRAG